jgi:DNA-binding beta-propeller fold protein YncE
VWTAPVGLPTVNKCKPIFRVFLMAMASLVTMAWAAPAQALTAEVPTRDPSLVGEAFTFRVVSTDAVGVTQIRWNFGDGTRTAFDVAGTEISHTYALPGHYAVLATLQDEAGLASVALIHTVHYPVLPRRPAVSAPIVYDKARNRIYNVNQDNDSISAIDPIALTKVAELPVYRRPEALALAPDGKLWVVHRDDYAVAIVDPDRFVIERGFRLPYASQPIGLAMSPSGDAAYITLMALGKLLKLNPVTGEVIGQVDVGSRARGVSVSSDGKDVYVTRFISSATAGEVVHVDGPSLAVVKRVALPADTATVDTDQQARGLPNYLFSVALSPDGREAWVPAKKDNIFRGSFLDGQTLNQDSTVRPMVSVINLAEDAEDLVNRIDMDDRSLPDYVEFSPLGDYAFVTLAGSDLIEVRDAYTKSFFTVLSRPGLLPMGTVIGPQNRMFVQGSLSRSVVVYDLADILVLSDRTAPQLVEIPTVEKEKLDPQVLLGKQVFHSASDARMTIQGYLTCAVCHFEGFEDGRVYDFSSRGEGLRNTTSLLGRRGMGQGRLHWSGNFDEVQDFEQEIRGLFLGRGFIADDALAVGTRSQPLGDPKAGLSPDLDAVAAYLTSLDHVNPSPYRNPDGSMTADAQSGKALFARLGCSFCHVGADFTDSSRGMLHDVGTLKVSSGTRIGGPLLGIDTPTLLGVWETAPYLHDGSAPTLRDVLTTANPTDQHGTVSALKPEEVDKLVAYLLQVDNEVPPRRLPFEPGSPADGGADGANPAPGVSPSGSGCACTWSTSRDKPALVALWLLAPLLVWCRRRRPGRRD